MYIVQTSNNIYMSFNIIEQVEVNRSGAIKGYRVYQYETGAE